MISSLRLLHVSILILTLYSFTACESRDTSESADIIIVNGSAQIEFDNELYENVDSLRVELTGIHSIQVIKEGFQDLYVKVYPHTSMARGDIGKYYLNLNPTDTSSTNYGLIINRKEDQQWVKFENSKITGLNSYLVTFEDVTAFNEEIIELDREKQEDNDFLSGLHHDIWEDNDMYDFDNRHIKESIYGFGVVDFLESGLSISGYQNNPPFESSLNMRLVIDSMGVVLIENAFSSVQFYGAWELRSEYDELYYSYPVQTYHGSYGYEKEADHRPGAIRSVGFQTLISEVLRTSLNQMLITDTVQYYLNEEQNLFLADQIENLEMEEIFIRNNEKGKSKSLEDCLESVVLIKGNSNTDFGSGSIISDDGYILTNYHVISGIQDELSVQLNNDESYAAELIRKDRLLDVALLKIDKNDCVPLKVNQDYNCDLGEEVYNIGTPSSIALFNSVATGNVSAIREIDGVNYIQTSGNVHSGMSGGPLLNNSMEQVGVHVWGWKSGNLWLKGIEFDIPVGLVFQRLNIKI